MLYWLGAKVVDTVLLVVKKGLLVNWKRELEFHSYLKPRVLTQSRRPISSCSTAQARGSHTL